MRKHSKCLGKNEQVVFISPTYRIGSKNRNERFVYYQKYRFSFSNDPRLLRITDVTFQT